MSKGHSQNQVIGLEKDKKAILENHSAKALESVRQKEDKIHIAILEDRNIQAQLDSAQQKIENFKR
jgi:hypothetical protein